MGLGIDPHPMQRKTPQCRCPRPWGVFSQLDESQKMGAWPPRLNPINLLEVTSHFLALILLAIFYEKNTKNNEPQTTVPLSLLTTHLCARACLSGKSAGGAGTGRRTWARPGRCREARARPGHLNKAWAMQGGSCEAWASEQGLGDAGRLVRGLGI